MFEISLKGVQTWSTKPEIAVNPPVLRLRKRRRKDEGPEKQQRCLKEETQATSDDRTIFHSGTKSDKSICREILFKNFSSDIHSVMVIHCEKYG